MLNEEKICSRERNSEIMGAYLDNKKLQYRSSKNEEWFDVNKQTHYLNFSKYEYRIMGELVDR